MSNIQILDCTLRDGGYINNWEFGEKSIKKIISKLASANIDIIECGFIDDVIENKNQSIFTNVEAIQEYIGHKKKDVMYVGMIAVPYISIEKISNYNGQSIDGIRVTFHEDEIDMALEYSQQLMNKGYKVFIQPVGTTSYSDKKLLELIERVNEIQPYAFYLVDTLGIMYKNELLRLFHLLDNNLEESIVVGFHSHNNLQLSFANAQELLSVHTKRQIIIDSSVFGMGRGAGNLCTELITHYINENISYNYDVIPLLEIFDEELSEISKDSNWGYSIPYYLAATNLCHPNYASYLLNKQTISVKSISNILNQLPQKERDLYNIRLIEKLYFEYQKNQIDDTQTLQRLKSLVTQQDNILIIGPGTSINEEKEKIESFINKNNSYVISVNFVPESVEIDAAFISNAKRFPSFEEDLVHLKNQKLVINTSNLDIKDEKFHTVNYSDLLVQDTFILDNAGLILLNLLKKIEVKNVYVAGFDGYKSEQEVGNYASKDMQVSLQSKEIDLKNKLIKNNFMLLKKHMNIEFITQSIYQ